MSSIDPNGQKVLTFETRIRNLFRVAELEDSIVEMALSGAWRNYSTGVGRDRWLEAEFDYFLISCGVAYDDVARVVNWSKDGASLAPLMDPKADTDHRRSAVEAANAWHSPGPESLIDRARTLGWLTEMGRMATPVPRRALIKARRGMSADQMARTSRADRIPLDRRRELDRVARELAGSLDDDERRYLVDRLRASEGSGGPRLQGN